MSTNIPPRESQFAFGNDNGIEIQASTDAYSGKLTLFSARIKNWFVNFFRGNPKLVDQQHYDITGASELGTTAPNPPDREDLIEIAHKPLVWYKRGWCGGVAFLASLLLDGVCYTMLFYDNVEKGEDFWIWFGQLAIMVLAAVAVTDVPPVFLAHNKRNKYDSDAQSLALCTKLLKFIFGLIILMVMVYRLVEPVLKMLFQEENPTHYIRSFQDLSHACLLICIPIGTSILSFVINYYSYNPLKNEINNHYLRENRYDPKTNK